MSTAKDLLLVDGEQSLGYQSFEQRKTPELIFAFVEPIGGGAKQAAEAFSRKLSSPTYGYTVKPLSLSAIIDEESARLNLDDPPIHLELQNAHPIISKEAKRIDRLQQLGNELRKRKGFDFLAKRAVKKINKYRMDHGMEKVVEGAARSPKPKRVAHLIRSIKHIEELRLLQSVYGGLLHVIAVSGNYSDHVQNFRPEANSDTENKKRIAEYDILARIDQKEDVPCGQQVREVFFKANIFLNCTKSSLEKSIDNFLQLLFGAKIGSPTQDERMMFDAFAASLRSTCLSRQVGAAICDKDGELVSVGWNDIPAVDGGLVTDQNERLRKSLCKSVGTCRSDDEKETLLKQLYNKLNNDNLLRKDRASFKRVKKVLKKAGISGLIEFSRAIHAEMEAILSAARTAKRGLKGGTIYVTTYPCDNCAKHIVASGIRRIVYIEPYPKSRATSFFPDCFADEYASDSTKDKVVLSQFVGISHPSYHLLFRQNQPRKTDAGKCVEAGEELIPITSPYLDSFVLYESQVVQEAEHE